MILQSKKVWISSQFIPAQVEMNNGKIERILPYGKYAVDEDYGKLRVIPGFIDIHTHGAYGYDATYSQEEEIKYWINRIPEEGVTAILPTTMTASEETILRGLKNIAAVAKSSYIGAEILGIHLEGPFISMEYKGAHNPNYITKATQQKMKMYQNAAEGLIKYVTIAPEEDEGFEFTRYCSQNDIVVSLGHSGATYYETILAIANGAMSTTHIFNGMVPFNHREPGIIGATLAAENIFSEIICDGKHSHISTLANFFRMKNKDYSIVVTDSLFSKGLKKGVYSFNNANYEVVEDGSVYLSGTKTLAGSSLKVNKALCILVEEALVPFDIALNSCTVNPARCIGVDDRKGKLVTGYDADIVILSDDYSVIQTYCKGRPML